MNRNDFKTSDAEFIADCHKASSSPSAPELVGSRRVGNMRSMSFENGAAIVSQSSLDRIFGSSSRSVAMQLDSNVPMSEESFFRAVDGWQDDEK